MSIQHWRMVWERGPCEPTQRLLLLAIADYANASGMCWPSMQTLSARTCVSVRRVQQLLRKLEAAGCVSVTPGSGRGRHSIIRLTIDPGEVESAVPNGKPDVSVAAPYGAAGFALSQADDEASDTVSPPNSVAGDTVWEPEGEAGDIVCGQKHEAGCAHLHRATSKSGAQRVKPGAETVKSLHRKGETPPHTREEPTKNLQKNHQANRVGDSPPGSGAAIEEYGGASAKRGDGQPDTIDTSQERLFRVLCWIVGWDHNTLTREERGQVAQTLGTLQKGGYSEADLRSFWSQVWLKDWRWQRNHSRPTLKQVRLEIVRVRPSTVPPGAAEPEGSGWAPRRLSAEDLALQQEMLEARKREPAPSLEEFVERLRLSALQGHEVAHA